MNYIKSLIMMVIAILAYCAVTASASSLFAVHHDRYWPLDVGNTAHGWNTYYYQPTWDIPSTRGSYYTTAPPSIVPRPFAVEGAWFNATLAYDSKLHRLVVGCRGHGTAVFKLRDGKHSTTARCVDHEAWKTAMLNVGKLDRITDNMHIIVIRSIG